MEDYENPLIHGVKITGNNVENPCTCGRRANQLQAVANRPFPPGYRFVPKDEELILQYLHRKINNETIPVEEISDVKLYKHSPYKLAEKHPKLGENEWYFFTPRDRKYRNGFRPRRSAGTGYWKATGADREIKLRDKRIIGFRKVLVFYEGKPPKGDKTDWIMHEFRANQPPHTKTDAEDMRLDDWVLCRVYKKVAKQNKNQEQEEEEDERNNSVDHEINPFCNHVDHHNHEINPLSNHHVNNHRHEINPLDEALTRPVGGNNSLVEPKEGTSVVDDNNTNTNNINAEYPSNVGLINTSEDCFHQLLYCHPVDYDTWAMNFSHRMGFGYGTMNPIDHQPFDSTQFLINEKYQNRGLFDQTFADLDNWGVVESYHQQEHLSNFGPSTEEDDLKPNLKIEDSCNGGQEEKPHDEEFDGQLKPRKKRHLQNCSDVF